MGTVIVSTKATAIPNPMETFTVFETAKYEHIPKKNAKIILSTNIDRTKMLIMFSIIFYLKCLTPLQLILLNMSVVPI